MTEIPKHRQDLIEDVHLFLGVFEELTDLHSFTREHQVELPCILEIVRDRYTALSDRLTMELRDHKPLGAVCQIDSDNSPGVEPKSPESLEDSRVDAVSA